MSLIVSSNRVIRSRISQSTEWIRPTDWLQIPSIGEGEEVAYFLLAIFNDDSNNWAIKISGDYTVDWGDGAPTEDIASGVQAEHTYDYSTISDNTLSVRGYKQVLVKIIPQVGNNLTAINLGVQHSNYSRIKPNFILD
jgi:hypothetical protein